jgi:7-dehydrocholesterol reductase
VIVASYRTADGREHENLLLVSGWWGLSRHFHYLPEMAAALAWTIPCGFQNLLPWLYFIYLAILLTHRALRDDRRCAAKYGPFWDQYRARVPFRIVPGVF